ncbi:MAG: deoxyguanosinetriphosphate triphosphohydrolase [Rickettsiales bacterium]|nr:deoxyguanosinetriphosphate triphosphohydrolase [Rickettsiales bacterium]
MLANYASDHKKSKGRLYNEKKSKNRNDFQRDRDRILHSSSFRRLEYKTQVFVNYESDHFRTRLTHSLEVAQISRTIAKKLKVDQDLTEAIALSHDIGHPPFGHAGEAALNNAMKKYNGFDHNAQALKILTEIEGPYAEFDGLNLTYETLEGLVKHNGIIKANNMNHYIKKYNKKHNLDLQQQPSIEAQIAAIADDIAYNNHDIDDGIRSGLLQEENLYEVEIIKNAFLEVDNKYPNLSGKKRLFEMRRRVYSAMVDDVIANSLNNFLKAKINNLNDVKNSKKILVDFTKEMTKQVLTLKKILRDNVYNHPKISLNNNKAKRIISDLFNFYFENPDLIPSYKELSPAQKNKKQDIAYFVSDYISGMTDRYAIQKHQENFDLYYLQQNFKVS